jgi:hypothetical protein
MGGLAKKLNLQTLTSQGFRYHGVMTSGMDHHGGIHITESAILSHGHLASVKLFSRSADNQDLPAKLVNRRFSSHTAAR